MPFVAKVLRTTSLVVTTLGKLAQQRKTVWARTLPERQHSSDHWPTRSRRSCERSGRVCRSTV